MGRQRLDKQRKRQDSTIYIGIEFGAGLHYKLLVSIRFGFVWAVSIRSMPGITDTDNFSALQKKRRKK